MTTIEVGRMISLIILGLIGTVISIPVQQTGQGKPFPEHFHQQYPFHENQGPEGPNYGPESFFQNNPGIPQYGLTPAAQPTSFPNFSYSKSPFVFDYYKNPGQAFGIPIGVTHHGSIVFYPVGGHQAPYTEGVPSIQKISDVSVQPIPQQQFQPFQSQQQCHQPQFQPHQQFPQQFPQQFQQQQFPQQPQFQQQQPQQFQQQPDQQFQQQQENLQFPQQQPQRQQFHQQQPQFQQHQTQPQVQQQQEPQTSQAASVFQKVASESGASVEVTSSAAVTRKPVRTV